LDSFIGETEGKRAFGYLGVEGRIILKCTLKNEGVGWIHVTQDSIQWRTLVNASTHLRVS